MTLIRKIWNIFKPLSHRERQEAYLSKATDLTDLERRVKRLENDNLSGWV